MWCNSGVDGRKMHEQDEEKASFLLPSTATRSCTWLVEAGKPRNKSNAASSPSTHRNTAPCTTRALTSLSAPVIAR